MYKYIYIYIYIYTLLYMFSMISESRVKSYSKLSEIQSMVMVRKGIFWPQDQSRRTATCAAPWSK